MSDVNSPAQSPEPSTCSENASTRASSPEPPAVQAAPLAAPTITTKSKFRKTTLLSPDEIQTFSRRSNLRAAWMVVANWALIFAACTLVAVQPNFFTVVLALVIIGGRQLGLAILMHECAHYSFFKDKRLNDWVGKWLLAAPVFADLCGYRKYHLRHHRLLGTEDDPDFANYRAFPISKASLRRKLLRDISGISGLRNFAGLFLMYSGVFDYDLSFKPKQNRQLSTEEKMRNFMRNAYPVLLMQLMLFGLCFAAGHPLLYLLWLLAFLTGFSLFSRIRNMAEHANVDDLLDPDPRASTRTTKANLLERLTVAPNYVNFHLEHHLLPAVPAYRLPSLHQTLVRKGAYENFPNAVMQHYTAVLRKLVY